MDELKKAAALAAVEMLPAGGIIGLGSGTTLAYAIEEIGRRIRAGQMDIAGVPTSYQARQLASEYGIPIRDPMGIDRIDVTIDGADEVDPQGNLIKGAGAAHVTEKIIAAMSGRLIIIVDESKIVAQLGTHFPIPLDVVPTSLSFVQRRLRDLGGVPAVRYGQGKIGPVISDLGNVVVDVKFERVADPASLDRQLNAIPGVVGHGLFVGLTSQVVVARSAVGKATVDVMEFHRKSAWTP